MAYQVTMFSALSPDAAELSPNVVLLGDPRWQRALRQLDEARWISVDAEFYEDGVGPFRDGRDIDYWRAAIRLVQVGLPSGLVLIADLGGLLDDRERCLAAHQDFLRRLRARVEDPRVPVVGMALLTEYLLFRIHFGWRMRCMRDVMLMSQVVWAGVASKGKRWTRWGPVIEPRLRHDLKSIAARLGISVDKTEQASDWAGRLTRSQLNYAAGDVLVPRQCWLRLAEIIREDGLQKSVDAECAAQPAFCECEYGGLPVDMPQALIDLERWGSVRERFWETFRERFPGANPQSGREAAVCLGELLDVRQCGQCGAEHDPVELRAPHDWRPAAPLDVVPQPKDGWLRYVGPVLRVRVRPEADARDVEADVDFDPTWRCACGAPSAGMQRTWARKFHHTERNRNGRAYVKTEVNDAALASLQDVPEVRGYLEGKSCAACMNWLRALVEHARGGYIRTDFRQIAGGYQKHKAGSGDAGKGMGRSSSGSPINTQNPSNLQPAHEAVGAPSVRRVVRAHRADEPDRLRRAAEAIEAGKFWAGPRRADDAATAARLRDVASEIERRWARRERAFLVADLSQAHARIAAQASQDPVLLRDFRAGIDFHLTMAHQLLKQAGHDVTFEEAVEIYRSARHKLHKLLKQLRKTAKPVNYGSLNLQGPPTLKQTGETAPEPVYFTVEEAAVMRDVWRRTYSGLWAFQRRTIRRADACHHTFTSIGVEGAYGEVRGLTGRRLFLVKDWQTIGERYGVKGTDCVAAVWMMTEADIIKRAMGWLVEDFDAHPEWGAEWTNMAHDEVDVECWAEYAQVVAAQIQRRFHEAMRWGGIVDLPVDEPGADPASMVKETWASK